MKAPAVCNNQLPVVCGIGGRSVGKADPTERLEVTVMLHHSHADQSAIRDFASDQGLSMVQSDAGGRTVVLSGTVAQFNEAFQVNLQRFEHPGGSYLARVGSIFLPAELASRVEAVLGLEPLIRLHSRG
jgi:hypothetical protein